MEFVQIKRRARGESSSFWRYKRYSAIWSSFENIRRIFLLSVWVTGTMYRNFDEKHSPNVIENQSKLQNSAYTARKSFIFGVFFALPEQTPSGINRDILKILPDAELKIITNSVHLVIWSRGFPTLISTLN